jgi:hypothetical protein
MQINSESQIAHPLNDVYAAYRDDLPYIASFIPDIKEIRVLSREPSDLGVKLHNLWVADRELPRMLKGVLKPEMMQWDDYADWNDGEHYVAWKLVIPAFKNQVRCEGRNSFYADGDRTRVVLTGNLEIKLESLPGVPKFMAKKLAPKIEEFIVKLITPNLKLVNESLGAYLDSKA